MIQNKNKNKVLAKKVKFCKTVFSQMRGLMFSRPKALVFVFNKEQKVHLHMFFVFYPIDVLWLNKNNKVVKIKENFKPFSFVYCDKKAKYVIELPAGIIKKTNTEVGDMISF